MTKFVHGPDLDEPLAKEDEAGALTYIHADGLGSVVRTTNGSGTVVTSYAYDALGVMTGGAAGYSYTGREWESEAGLYYYRARFYEPTIGRFISADPIRFFGGINFYEYAANDPVSNTDPLGLESGAEFKWQRDVDMKDYQPPSGACAVPGCYIQDWCGSGLSEVFVPDALGGVDLRSLCMVHDACYGKCTNFTRSQCDEMFAQMVQTMCKTSPYPWCSTLGSTYWWGIRVGGRGPFRAARQHHPSQQR